MTKNPFVNALAASFYIIVIASMMYYGSKLAGGQHVETVFAPIAIISLFTLSAAVMGYTFLYNPLQLHLEGEKKRAASLFIKTILAFACITAVIVLTLFSITYLSNNF